MNQQVKQQVNQQVKQQMKLRSSIDLGTNTCLLLIAEWDPQAGQVTRVIEDHSTVVRLGQGVDQNRRLHPEAKERTRACLKRYAERVRALGLRTQDTLCVSTSQARDAVDSAKFFEEIQGETGFVFQTLTGDQEAELTFQGGLLPGMDSAQGVVIDIGGGSTEFMSQHGGKSLDIGSVRFTERFLKSDPVTDEEFWACQEAVDVELSKMGAWRAALPSGAQWVAVAGTATTLAAWHLNLKSFHAPAIDSVTLTRGDLHRMVEELKWRTVAERRALPGVEAGRADVLLAGALILWRSMEVLGFKECRVSTRGLRFGVLSLAN